MPAQQQLLTVGVELKEGQLPLHDNRLVCIASLLIDRYDLLVCLIRCLLDLRIRLYLLTLYSFSAHWFSLITQAFLFFFQSILNLNYEPRWSHRNCISNSVGGRVCTLPFCAAIAVVLLLCLR